MIDGRGHAVITGFGCAKVIGSSLESPIAGNQVRRTDSSCGTRGYQAPEIVLGWTHDFAVDCWSFGIILYYMIFRKVGLNIIHPYLVTEFLCFFEASICGRQRSTYYIDFGESHLPDSDFNAAEAGGYDSP